MQGQAVALGQAAVLDAARRRADVKVQRPAADFWQPLDGRPQRRRPGALRHRLQSIQRQGQHRAQCQRRQEQHRADQHHPGGGGFLGREEVFHIRSVNGGIFFAPQPPAPHRPRRRPRADAAQEQQQPAHSSAVRTRQQHKHHGRQQYQIQKQRVAAPDRHSGKKRRDGHKRQQHEQPARTRLAHGKICVETCIQTQLHGVGKGIHAAQEVPLHQKQQHQIPHGQRQHSPALGGGRQRRIAQRQPQGAQRRRAGPDPGGQRQRKRAVHRRQQPQRQQQKYRKIHAATQNRLCRRTWLGQQHAVHKFQPGVRVGGLAAGQGAQPGHSRPPKMQHGRRGAAILGQQRAGRVGTVGRAQRLPHRQLVHLGRQFPVDLF